MPFTSETAKQFRGPGHRRKRAHVEAEKTASEVVRGIIEANAKRLANKYVSRATGKHGDKVLTHAIDKLIPDEQTNLQRALNIQFIQFNNHNSLQLQAKGVPGAILAGDGNGHQAGSEGLAPAVGQRQNGLEFHNFEDVPGE